ncbi:putative transcription factor C2H2 family [Medicago truncatula]|uniref:Putative transcription factor C2H2 family n=1 Tax=Medicago truncatula TaxID=3880 RepID=G7I4V4_MEDTR|nr:hypothetical protein MTR_1g075780 [Medicago truncatula]RHN80371.1 putative transcription factor C2H2 family [Medicago truncatula]
MGGDIKNFVCGLCNHDCTNFESLISHLESHMARENLAIARLNHTNPQVKSMPNPLPPNFPMPKSLHENKTFVRSMLFQKPQQQSNVVDLASFSAPPSIHQQGAGGMEVSPIDGTKPYINMLDKPIDKNVFINFIDETSLNLELKL